MMPNRIDGNLRVKFLGIVCLVCCCILSCKRVSDDPLARNWKAITPEPAAGAVILQHAAESRCVWSVSSDPKDAHVTIEPSAHVVHPQAQEIRLKTEAGTLMGTNRGEYGGSLSLTGPDGAPSKRLLAENVIQLLPVKSGVLVLTGLLHLDADQGAGWLYSKISGEDWSVKKLFDLDGYPRAIYSDKGEILVVTGHGVSRVDELLNHSEVALLPFAQTLPNSVSKDALGRVYIGMNAFVVRLVPTKTGYMHEWFTRPECLP